MDDRKFDSLVARDLVELPPEKLPVERVNPWRRAMTFLLWGLALNSLDLNFINLQYSLPAVGSVLQVLGLRALRRENLWFRCAWAVSLLLLVRHFAILTLNATRWGELALGGAPGEFTVVLGVCLDMFRVFCLWRGLLAVQRKAGEEKPSAAPAGALVLWKLAMLGLALLQAGGWLVVLAMLGIFALILRSLWKLSHLLDETGYAIQAAPVRCSDALLGWGCLGALLGCVIIGMLCFARCPMDWTPAAADGQAGLEEVRENLLSLGFPEEVLNDLSAGDLARFEGAVRLLSDERAVVLTGGNGRRQSFPLAGDDSAAERGDWEQKLVDFAVEVSGEEGENPRFLIVHSFEWLQAPFYRGNEGIEIWPGWQCDGYGRPEQPVLSGRILFERDGETFTSGCADLGTAPHGSNSFLGDWNDGERLDILARYALPLRGDHIRGYLLYDVELTGDEAWICQSWANYTHQQRLIYPFRTPDTAAAHWNEDFSLVQTQLSFER